MPTYDKLKERIWLEESRKVKKSCRKNYWTAIKEQLIDSRAKLSIHFQTEPTKKEIMEYRVYNDLIALCADNE